MAVSPYFVVLARQLSTYMTHELALVSLYLVGSSLVLMLRSWILLSCVHSGANPYSSMLIFLKARLFILSPGRAGEVFRAVLLHRRFGVSRSSCLAILAAERLYGLLSAGILLLALLYSLHLPYLFLSIFFAISVVFLFNFSPVVLGLDWARTSSLVWFIPLRFRPVFVNKFGAFLRSGRSLFSNLKIFSLSLLLTSVSWLLESSALGCVVQYSGGIKLQYSQILSPRLAMAFGGVLSPLPAGLGLSEVAATTTFLAHGLSMTQSLTSVALFRFFALAIPMLLGLFAWASSFFSASARSI